MWQSRLSSDGVGSELERKMSYRKEESLILENFSEKHKQGDIVSSKIVQTARTSSSLIIFTELRLIVCLVLLRTNGKYHAQKNYFGSRCTHWKGSFLRYIKILNAVECYKLSRTSVLSLKITNIPPRLFFTMRFNNMYIYNVINDLIAFNSFIPDYLFFHLTLLHLNIN